jgi:hypothetical protein
VPHARDVERLDDRERPVPEVVLRREQLDVDAVAGQVAQRQHRLEPGDAAAGDQHVEPSKLLGREAWPMVWRVCASRREPASGRIGRRRRETRTEALCHVYAIRVAWRG